ncbi:hypothetical protein AAVH_23924 [Aphelenchoides avenae]|nr:hypothetical protein AAVH_23924 [Aphelenchus avenae]
MPAEWFQRCDATDEGVLDYLFNSDYPLKERFLKLYRFRASKHFLAKMFERMHSTTNIESVQFWSNIRLASQDLKQYEAQHEILQNSDISCVRFRTDVFCSLTSFKGRSGKIRFCRFTTLPENFDDVFNRG